MGNNKSNKNLHSAKRDKIDEFYTQIEDIEKELQLYTHHFRDKVVYCNCDDPRWSNFFLYFYKNFKNLGLKRLLASCYKNRVPNLFSETPPESAVYIDYRGEGEPEPLPLRGDGDFRSPECIEFLKQADIVVTNPPFSLFREYVAQLIEYNKKFLIIGNIIAITYKEIFKLFKENRIWLGHSVHSGKFRIPEKNLNKKNGVIDKGGISYMKLGNIRWYTNLSFNKSREWLKLHKTYNPEEYIKYNNYEAIEVSKIKEIPIDYDGVMGVPITFLDRYNPEQFEILGNERDLNISGGRLIFRGKNVFKRILIKHKMK